LCIPYQRLRQTGAGGAGGGGGSLRDPGAIRCSRIPRGSRPGHTPGSNHWPTGLPAAAVRPAHPHSPTQPRKNPQGAFHNDCPPTPTRNHTLLGIRGGPSLLKPATWSWLLHGEVLKVEASREVEQKPIGIVTKHSSLMPHCKIRRFLHAARTGQGVCFSVLCFLFLPPICLQA